MAAAAPAVTAAAPALAALLATLRRRTRTHVCLESLALVALTALACGWAALATDWLLEPPAWVRAAAVIATVGACLWLCGTRLVARLLTPLPDASLALAVERRHPALGDGLSTAIDLAGRGCPDSDPELVARTIAAAVARLGEIRPAAVFRGRRLALLLAATAVAAGASAAAAAARPDLAQIWARRVLFLAGDPWPRRVTLVADGFPGGVRTVARGSDAEVVVHAQATGPAPEFVELRTRTADSWRSERMGTRGGPTEHGQVFAHVLEAVADDTAIEIRGGDARLRGLRLRVADPPIVAELGISVTLPAYLGGATRTVPASRVVPVPRGSQIQLAVTSSKPLAEATVAVRSTASDRQADDPAAERVVATLEPAAVGGRTLTAAIPPLDADTGVLVRLVDLVGLANRDPLAVVLTAEADAAPRVDMRLGGISTAVTPRARLPIEGVVADDHGLATARVVVQAAGARHELPIARVRGGETAVEFAGETAEVVSLEPLAPEVGGRIVVTVSARDGCPLDGGPHETSGDSWTLDVVTPESLQSMLEAREILLRRRYEAVIEDLSQARARLATAAPASPDDAVNAAARCGEATARAAGETAEVAAEFRAIRRELSNNGLLTPDRESRLVDQIAAPLERIVAEDLGRLASGCRTAAVAGGERQRLGAQADVVLRRMREVLARMIELESINEVIERLRGVIRAQEQIRSDTLERQRKRGREALESP